MIYLTRKKHSLNHTVRGHGPVLVLLHGYLCSLHYWDHITAELEQDFTVVNIDLLGFGKSPKPRMNAYDFDEHIRWITNTLDLYGFNEPLIMVGHSMGALIALRYASRFPEKMRRVILMNLPVFKDNEEARRELANTNLLFRAGLYWEFHRVICPVMDTGIMKQLTRQVIPSKFKGMETYLFASSAAARKRSLKNVIEGQRSMDELENLVIPATIISGKNERHTYLDHLKAIKHAANTELFFTNTGHHTPIDRPELVAMAANLRTTELSALE